MPSISVVLQNDINEKWFLNHPFVKRNENIIGHILMKHIIDMIATEWGLKDFIQYNQITDIEIINISYGDYIVKYPHYDIEGVEYQKIEYTILPDDRGIYNLLKHFAFDKLLYDYNDFHHIFYEVSSCYRQGYY